MSASAPTLSKHPIKARKMNFPFDEGIPRHWIADSAMLTHLANGLNLLFPAGERFFIRSCKPYAHLAKDDGALHDALRGFMAQEVRHGIEHERFFDILREQGYDVDTFLEDYQRLAYELIEPNAPPKLRLAATAALEHFTAIFGELVLTHGLEHAHPTLRDLFLWHAAEEIEHKSVTFDLLQLVDDSYALRIGGLLIASATLLGFWMLAVNNLMRQDRALEPDKHANHGEVDLRTRALELRAAFVEHPLAKGLARGFLDYLRPDFHPTQHDNLGLATDYLESIGRLER